MELIVGERFVGLDAESLTDDELVNRYAEGLWLEEREISRMAAAIGRAFQKS